jgi:hypothetical protein
LDEGVTKAKARPRRSCGADQLLSLKGLKMPVDEGARFLRNQCRNGIHCKVRPGHRSAAKEIALGGA